MRTQKTSKFSLRRSPRKGGRSATGSTLFGKRRNCGARKIVANQSPHSSKVSEKLEALKNLIPSRGGDEVSKSDDLFKDTADYIVMLRTQVAILQKLIDFYGSSEKQES